MRWPVICIPLILAGCGAPPEVEHDFWSALQSHCGKAFVGQLVSEDEADADFRNAEMVMHVSECGEDRVAIPFHVKPAGSDWDRSRTWLVTRTEQGFRLKHDHRHEDGESDAVTMYGGDSIPPGTRQTQDFPVDSESIALFEREGLAASVTNVWSIEVDPAGTENATFAYQLRRYEAEGAPEDRHFRVEFDLTRPVPPPPPAWGHETATNTETEE